MYPFKDGHNAKDVHKRIQELENHPMSVGHNFIASANGNITVYTSSGVGTIHCQEHIIGIVHQYFGTSNTKELVEKLTKGVGNE